MMEYIGATKRQTSPAITRALLICLFIIWSNSFTAIKYLLGKLDPMDLVLARFLPVMVFCTLFILISRVRRTEALAILKATPARVIAMALAGVAGYNFFLYTGQHVIKPGAAALLTTLAPLFILILAVFFLGEKVPPRRLAGILVAFLGLYIVVRWGRVGMATSTTVSRNEIRYAIITTLAPFCWAVYTILGKNLMARFSPTIVTYLTLVIGTIPVLAIADADFFRSMAGFSLKHWIALSHLSVLCTIVGFYIWNAALSRLPSAEIASYIYLNPLFAAIFGYFIFGEQIAPLFAAGSAIVLLGLYLASNSR